MDHPENELKGQGTAPEAAPAAEPASQEAPAAEPASQEAPAAEPASQEAPAAEPASQEAPAAAPAPQAAPAAAPAPQGAPPAAPAPQAAPAAEPAPQAAPAAAPAPQAGPAAAPAPQAAPAAAPAPQAGPAAAPAPQAGPAAAPAPQGAPAAAPTPQSVPVAQAVSQGAPGAQQAFQGAPGGQQQASQGAPGAEQAGPAPEKNSVWNLMLGVITSPGKTLAAVARERRVGSGIVIALVLSFFAAYIPILGFNPGDFSDLTDLLGLYGEEAFFRSLVQQFGVMLAIFATGMQLIVLFVRAGVFKLLGEMVGEKGYDGMTMVATLGYATMPNIFAPIVGLIGEAVNMPLLSFLFSLALSIWLIVVSILAIKAALQSSTGKAVLVFFLPVIAIVALLVLLSFVVVSIFMSIPTSAFYW